MMKKLFFVLSGLVEVLLLAFMFLISNISSGSLRQDKEDLDINPIGFIALKLFAGLIVSSIVTLLGYGVFWLLMRTMRQSQWSRFKQMSFIQLVVLYLIWIISLVINVRYLVRAA